LHPGAKVARFKPNPDRSAEDNKEDMFKQLRRRFSAYRYVFVGADFHSEGGAWLSIYSFYRELNAAGEPVLLADLRRDDGLRRWVCALLFSPRIIVNGMAAVERWTILAGLALRKDAVIYLHDTNYMLDSLQRQKPLLYRTLSLLLRRRTVLCVSEQMAELYRKRFNVQRAVVVYELTELNPSPVFAPDKVHILMVGTINRRKGYPLFVRTAELAAKEGLAWEFHWVGALGESDLAPVSDAITWWGWRDDVGSMIGKADVFFLTSVDDPQPLACLEALALGHRVVVFRGTGSAEVVEGLRGCGVYELHDAESALGALKRALDSEPDRESYLRKLERIASLDAFRSNLDSAFEAARN